MTEWIDKDTRIASWVFSGPKTVLVNGQEYWWVPEIQAYVGYAPGADTVELRINCEGYNGEAKPKTEG